MQVWRLNYIHPHEGTIVLWGRNKPQVMRKLEIAREQMQDTDPEPTYSLKHVDIPTNDKDAMILWLEQNLNTDNG